MSKFNKLLLPVGTIIVLVLALISPATGLWIKNWSLNNWLIVLIFLICGSQTEISSLKISRNFVLLFASGAIVSLLLSPFIALLIGHLLHLSSLAVVGLVVISAVPPTLSSGIVMTGNAKGNIFLAMTLTIGYNLLGVFTLPIVLNWTVGDLGTINTNPGRMLLRLAFLVILPFVIGLMGVKSSRKKLPNWTRTIPSFCVLLLLLAFFANSSDNLKNSPPEILLVAAACGVFMHLMLLVIMWYVGRLWKYSAFDCKALIFTGASKTITLALTTLSILGADDGAAVIPGLVFYFLQMMIDSLLAARMGTTCREPSPF